MNNSTYKNIYSNNNMSVNEIEQLLKIDIEQKGKTKLSSKKITNFRQTNQQSTKI